MARRAIQPISFRRKSLDGRELPAYSKRFDKFRDDFVERYAIALSQRSIKQQPTSYRAQKNRNYDVKVHYAKEKPVKLNDSTVLLDKSNAVEVICKKLLDILKGDTDQLILICVLAKNRRKILMPLNRKYKSDLKRFIDSEQELPFSSTEAVHNFEKLSAAIDFAVDLERWFPANKLNVQMITVRNILEDGEIEKILDKMKNNRVYKVKIIMANWLIFQYRNQLNWFLNGAPWES